MHPYTVEDKLQKNHNQTDYILRQQVPGSEKVTRSYDDLIKKASFKKKLTKYRDSQIKQNKK